MKREERLTYLALANEANAIVCTFCRYADWGGTCSESFRSCDHPLDSALWDIMDAMDAACIDTDCWAFRPEGGLNIHDAADIVGMILVNHWTRWAWTRDASGQIRVGGRQ